MILTNKKQLQEAVAKDIEKTMAEYILDRYPEAAKVSFSPHVEYNDQDDDFYSSMISVYADNSWDDLINIYEADHQNGDYQRLVDWIEGLQALIDGRDFVWAFGFDASINLRPYKK